MTAAIFSLKEQNKRDTAAGSVEKKNTGKTDLLEETNT